MNSVDFPKLIKSLNGYGVLYKIPNGIIFFGNKKFEPQKWEFFYQNSAFLEQIHGNVIVEGNPGWQVGDGLWTQNSSLPLVIRSADCVPVFLTSKNCDFTCALHVGWKGLAAGILDLALETHFSNRSLEQVFIGPHIHQEDFYLDDLRFRSLLKSQGLSINEAFDLKLAEKSQGVHGQFNVDLEGLIRKRVKSLSSPIVRAAETNTYRSLLHYSHRRYSGNKGRQYSFILKL